MVLVPKFNDNVKKLIKVKDVTIGGVIFNVHCEVTAVLLLFASSVVSMKMYVGQPIQCIADALREKDQLKVIETFCWINSTFTLQKTENGAEEQVHHAYYQWVCFILFFQGLIFYTPKWMWKHLEGGLMKHLQGKDAQKLILETEERRRKTADLANYFVQRLQGHRHYTISYWCHELLCLVNVLTQACILHQFFSTGFVGSSSSFFWSSLNMPDLVSLKYPPGSSTKTMEHIFPLTSKCTFHKYGAGGGIQLHDALCVLALNIYNRIIFIAMWYWFLLLIFLLTLLLLYRVVLLFSPFLRYVLLKTSSKNDLTFETSFVARVLTVSDWWVLYLLKSNIDPILFKDIILDLFKKIYLPKVIQPECCEALLM